MREIGIVGDIHGEATALRDLLARVGDAVDQLVFVGDYVNRGRGSAQVLEQLVAEAGRRPCHFLEGNHDASFRRALEGEFDAFLTMGGASTVRSYVDPPFADVKREFLDAVPPSHREFLDRLQPRYEAPDLVVAHALPSADFSHRFRVGGHAPQMRSAPTLGEDFAYIDTGCGTLDGGQLTCLMWPSLVWESVAVQ